MERGLGSKEADQTSVNTQPVRCTEENEAGSEDGVVGAAEHRLLIRQSQGNLHPQGDHLYRDLSAVWTESVSPDTTERP